MEKRSRLFKQNAIGEYIVAPIGLVHSRLKNLADCPLQEREGAPEAYLELNPDYQVGLDGIVVGMELVLLTWLHLADRNTLKCYMRNERTGGMTGVFNTRSPDRPNPIGMHTVIVLEIVNRNTLRVYPLEVLDSTPILDIKLFLNSAV
jgi:tRNA-Thr(GGU) m(6)t(6)A37 methyltransferase TsaA